jgi:RecA/RadA recombinase
MFGQKAAAKEQSGNTDQAAFGSAGLVSTGVDFVDEVLGGGTKRSGVYGVIGPTGVGKSTLAAMLAVRGALRAHNTTGNEKFDLVHRRKRPWILLDLRGDSANTRRLVISYAANVDQSAFFQTDKPVDSPAQNENVKSAKGLKPSLNENDREASFQRTVTILNGNIYALSACKTCDTPSPAGILHYLLSFSDSVKRGIGGIVIDDVRLSWYAHSQKFPKDTNERRFYLDFVNDFCRALSIKFRCPVWVTHQMSGNACSRRPADQLTHRDAADCKNFADQLDACLVMGTPSEDEHVFSLRCTKGDTRAISKEPVLLKHDSHSAGLVPADNFVRDTRNRTWTRMAQTKEILSFADQEHLDNLIEDLGRGPMTVHKPKRSKSVERIKPEKEGRGQRDTTRGSLLKANKSLGKSSPKEIAKAGAES